jgi:hypothetical protein
VNPFTLEPTESNIQFLYSFIKLLLVNGGAELEPEDDDVVHKAVQDMYLLDVSNRRLSNLFLPKKLDRYLAKWVGRGVYANIFDNVEDGLSLSRLPGYFRDEVLRWLLHGNSLLLLRRTCSSHLSGLMATDRRKCRSRHLEARATTLRR